MNIRTQGPAGGSALIAEGVIAINSWKHFYHQIGLKTPNWCVCVS